MNPIYEATRALIRLYSYLMLDLDILCHSQVAAGPKIFAANHPSATDPFILHILSKEPMSVLIISNAFAVPIFGEFIRRLRQIQVLPEQGELALEQARQCLLMGSCIGVFPEGDFSPQAGGYRKPHSGAVRLAVQTGVPIIPVGIYLPRERNLRIESRLTGNTTIGYWYLHGPYGVTVGRPLWLNGDVHDPEQVRTHSQGLMDSIKMLACESESRVRRLFPVPARY
jgi:1-acyl-sn-glycerol-3-phosphate acyltransferase